MYVTATRLFSPAPPRPPATSRLEKVKCAKQGRASRDVRPWEGGCEPFSATEPRRPESLQDLRCLALFLSNTTGDTQGLQLSSTSHQPAERLPDI